MADARGAFADAARARAAVGFVATAVAAALAVVLVAGCGVLGGITTGVFNPVTPEQSRARVVEAAEGIVKTLGLPVETAVFWHSSCGDGGAGPFRGRMRIGYPLAPSFEASDAEVAGWIERLRDNGWSTDSGAHVHGTALTNNGVRAVFWPQSVSDTNRGLELLGECRDVTTTKKTAGDMEHIDLR